MQFFKQLTEGITVVSLRYLAIPVLLLSFGIFYTGIQVGSHLVRRFNLVETHWFRIELEEQQDKRNYSDPPAIGSGSTGNPAR